MISEEIAKIEKSLTERGLPEDSYYEVEFEDGSFVSEKNTNWSSFSTETTVIFCGRPYKLYLCNYPVKSLRISLKGLNAEITEIPEGCSVYQFIRSERMLAKDIDRHTIVGRGIGIVRNGLVIEERFINVLENSVQGMRL